MSQQTIFMIHGMWGGGWAWDNYKPFFENKGYKCVAPTLRYHNVDPKDEPDPELGMTSLLDYASDLAKEIKKLDDKPIIMGHSMGGILAQILGSRGLGKSLVLLTSAPPAGVFALKPSVIKSFWSVLTQWEFWNKAMKLPFEASVYSMLHLISEKEKREAYKKFVYESGRAAFELGFWLLDARKAAYVDEKKITCPMLMISGEEDRITPASVQRQTAKKYKHIATYKEFPHHAHWVIGEPGWKEIAEFILNWLEGQK